MELSEFPDEIRIKLSKQHEKEFWEEIDNRGGIKEFSSSFSYSASKMYNWKNKESFMPLNVIKKIIDTDLSDKIIAYKGKGRSKAVKNPIIPLPENNELLTRIKISVHLSNGIPVYQAKDRGLIERFGQLLQEYGDVPYTVYNRSSVYELRYPKYLHTLFEKMDYNEDFSAMIDEKGSVEDNLVRAGEQEELIDEFKGELFSRDKALKLALERGNNQKVKKLMMKEAEKVERTFNN